MILYINQRLNDDPRVITLLKNLGHDMQDLEQSRLRFDPGIPSIYSRAGNNTLPFCNGLAHRAGFAMPQYQDDFKNTWAEVTDQRCHDLRRDRFDKPWIIAWSGGIDSTTVVAAILKNLSPADLENITIACNKFSIWENPLFFQQFIRPNFRLVESKTLLNLDTVDNSIIIDGEPGDQLFAGGISLPMMLSRGLDFLEKDSMAEADLLIDYIAQTPRQPNSEPPGRVFAEWYYSVLLDNIKSVDVPVRTFHDFLWWSYFNFAWTSVKLRMLERGDFGSLTNAGTYLQNFVHWFDSDHYQLWAMTNNVRDQKYGVTIAHHKIAAKRYIFDLDHNDYNLKYQTKLFSGDITWMGPKIWYCITQDLSLLNLQDDWHTIQELLPQHLNLK